jgi:protein-S-isoprenylcysteine O-methyltransferase Ste14
MLLAAAGFALLLPNAFAFGALAALVIALELQVRFVEETYLRQVHGDAYDRYLARAGRFAPGVGRSRRA